MRIVKLNKAQLDGLDYAIEKGIENHETIRLAYDELDQGIKFKIGNGPWSPPMKTEER